MHMSPRPAPDLTSRRDQVVRLARDVAESDGWPAVTMRRLAADLGVTQPVLYSAFAGRQALVDAVALDGYTDLAAALEDEEATPLPRMLAYLGFAAGHPQVYAAMSSMPTGLPFAADDAPEPLRRAFAALAAVFPGAEDARVEVAWAALHGLATLSAGGRLRPADAAARLDIAHRMLTQEGTR
jgi:AcrR family transcriptional regulator